jgi:hypothetical protein
MLAVMFFFLARAVTQGASAAYLLLPLAVEFTSIMWLGLLLAYFVVDCPKFNGESKRPLRVIFWTLLLIGAISAIVAWSEGRFDASRIRPGWATVWQEVWATGLVWAIAAGVLGLVVSSTREVLRWRVERGVFVWNSVFAPSLRIAVVMLAGIFSPFVLIPLGDSLVPWLLDTPSRIAWTAFGFLLLVELGALAIGVGMHRTAQAEHPQAAQADKRTGPFLPKS